MSDSRMMRYSLPSTEISVPAYFPYRTVSPTLTVNGSSFLPLPTATTWPFWGFSLAVSGMMIPKDVFSSAAAGSTRTLSARGLMLTFAIRDKRFVVKIRQSLSISRAKYVKTPEKPVLGQKAPQNRDIVSARTGKKLTRVPILPSLLDSDSTKTYIQTNPLDYEYPAEELAD